MAPTSASSQAPPVETSSGSSSSAAPANAGVPRRKGETSRVGPVQAASKSGRHGGAGARHSRHQGARLGEANEKNIGETDLADGPAVARPPVNGEHHGAEEHEHRCDKPGLAEVSGDPAVQEQAGGGHRDRADRDQHQRLGRRAEPARTVSSRDIAEGRGRHQVPVLPEVGDENGKGAGMQANIECEALIFPAEEPRNEDEMARR